MKGFRGCWGSGGEKLQGSRGEGCRREGGRGRWQSGGSERVVGGGVGGRRVVVCFLGCFLGDYHKFCWKETSFWKNYQSKLSLYCISSVLVNVFFSLVNMNFPFFHSRKTSSLTMGKGEVLRVEPGTSRSPG